MQDNDRLYQMLERLDGKVDEVRIQVAEIKTTQDHQQTEINDIKADVKGLRDYLTPEGKKIHTLWYIVGIPILGAFGWLIKSIIPK